MKGHPTVGKPALHWREPPVPPKREQKFCQFKVDDFDNLKSLYEEALKYKQGIMLEDIKIDHYDYYEQSYSRFAFKYPESDSSFNERKEKYQKELDSYNQWMVDYADEIKAHKEKQALKKNKLQQKKEKELRQKIESLQKELNKVREV